MPNNYLFDRFAPYYDYLIREKELEPLCEPLKLPADGWMLDAGGGTGRSSNRLAHMVDHLAIIDLSHAMLKVARRKGLTNLVQASSTALPFAPETFSRVVAIDALHHMGDPAGSVRELVRTLKRGGRMLIEEPDISIIGVKLVAFLEKVLLMKSHFHTPTEIEELVAANGVSTQVTSDGEVSTWVIADKSN